MKAIVPSIRVCRKCQRELPGGEFYFAAKTCKGCQIAKVKAHRAANAEHYREYDRQRAKTFDRRRELSRYERERRARIKAAKQGSAA
jgi:hypothetical protein